ncbi:eCIS core domain-containing protein [Ruminiclostridium hungatei]|nr:DUF4157 domain-containing protein [Ruminiclostridium hungatei]
MEEGRQRKRLRKMGLSFEKELPVQGKMQQKKQDERSTASNTGLPDKLQTGLENLSGVSLSDVQVHYNSDKPQQEGALAYTQGSEIYIGPGQENYLPHEGWHVVQQKQGRVSAAFQLKSGLDVNADEHLEKEADIMGKKAESNAEDSILHIEQTNGVKAPGTKGTVIQRVTTQEEGMKIAAQNTKKQETAEKAEIIPAAYGETSENVKKIQQVLISMNYWTGRSGDKASGYFGDVTRESLINFQTGYMKLDKQELYDKKGKYVGCGPGTAKSLNSAYKLLNNSNVPEQAKNGIMGIGKSPENNSTYNWDIKAGVYNAYVKEAQLMLMNMGYKLPKYGADGKWSNSGETYEALLSFQKGCETELEGIKKNGTAENRKEVEHFQGIEPTGKLDQRTYAALQKEKTKKVTANYNNTPPKKVENGNKGTGNSKEDTEAEQIANRTFYYYFGQNETGVIPANASVTPEVATEMLKNLSKGEYGFKPEFGKGGCSWFVTEGNPYVGISPNKNIDIPVDVTKPNGFLVFDEARLLQMFNTTKTATEAEAMSKFRNYNGLSDTTPLNSKMQKAFTQFHKRFAESRMWDKVGELVRASSSKVGEVILQEGSAFSKQGSGKFAVVADASKVQVKGGITALAEIVKGKGDAVEPALVEAAEAMATKLKWAGTVRNVFRYGGKVLIVVGVAADVYKVYVAEDKVKAVVESAGGWAGATAGAAAFAAWWTPADVAGPWAWVAHGVGTLIAGGVGYWAGSGITRTIYELVIEE